ncbi:BZ3500_MvSof-1268-A1-R1_Chr11-1g03285 [Microbotryum saponariae]|uniref:BZ3500_MvSof-1268-A1-R1_Chr11-1g03285 protein n=1 Tax=Microbotryum saponariae TaxID=289078 RepID=A0A2X0NFI2_9BASI|nr:BZ3501_MvSof-1269-A2-R1_Chr11g02860 [Microbotryum saponariae]SDA03887.1 BZ3500_MvSof-1268-A1-R1_Chr11-1g03285 [Microbotryum saponariae]
MATTAELPSQAPAPPPGSSNTIPSDISSLESLLATLDRARQALPTILRSFSSSTSSNSIEALSRAYRSSSVEAAAALRTLGDQLTVLDPILVRAQKSQAEDATAILVKARVDDTQQLHARDDTLWIQLDALAQHQRQKHLQQQQQIGKGFGSLSNPRASRRTYPHEPATFAPPQNRHQLHAILQGWKVRHADNVPHCEIDESGIDSAPETTEIKFVLRSVMKAYISIHWETPTKSDDQGDPIAIPRVERVACFGLNETKSSYLASQYVLFQNLTRTAMGLIEGTRSTLSEPVSGIQTDLEQVLVRRLFCFVLKKIRRVLTKGDLFAVQTFLTKPPLPF